jgi:hypothetical protein
MKRAAQHGPLATRLMTAAAEEATRLRHGFVGCEHLLLALLADEDPTAKDVLSGQGVGLSAARAAVDAIVAAGKGDGPRRNPADLLARLGVDLAAIRRQTQAEFGTHAIEALYRNRYGRHLKWGPLCGLPVAPLMKKALFAGPGGHLSTGHVLLSLLNTGSPGLAEVLDALEVHTGLLRAAAADWLRDTG